MERVERLKDIMDKANVSTSGNSVKSLKRTDRNGLGFQFDFYQTADGVGEVAVTFLLWSCCIRTVSR